MTLTNDDKNWIRGAIAEGVTEAIETIVLSQFDELKLDIKNMKLDIEEMKLDIENMKLDIEKMKGDIAHLQVDMAALRRSTESLDGRVETLENDVREIYLILHKQQHPKLSDPKFERLPIRDRVAILEREVTKLSRELKTAS